MAINNLGQSEITMKKIKIVHIHSDSKFLKLGDAFFSSEFENELVFLGNKNNFETTLGSELHFFDKSKNSVKSIVDFCSDFDLVVFYSIDALATKIILALPKKMKIGWRFFGFELYYKNKNKYYTEYTKQILEQELNTKNTPLRRLKNSILSLLKNYDNALFLKAISRCNLFFGLYEEEYLILKKDFPNLPFFIPVSLNMDSLEEKSIAIQKEKYFLVGHNRIIWNNHFDILDIIKRNKNTGNYQASLLVNYGQKGFYFKKLVQYAQSIQDVVLIEEFMSIEEFDQLYLKCSALVINSKRQMAGNNIRKALEHGTKVYLDPENSFYDYLKNNGFLIYTIQQFESDYASGNLTLNPEMAQFNYNKLVELTKNNSSVTFRANVIRFLNENTNT